jgi:hypothetical protein
VPKPIVICIGLNRTGTTSFGDAVEILGFSRLGWTEDSDSLMHAWNAGDLETLRSVAREYDALEDIPWPLVYRELADLFPAAKFVLTRRKSTEAWLRSQVSHTRTHEYWGHEAIYGAMSAEAASELYCRTYGRHLSDVREFFASSDRFLEVCSEEGDGWAELCTFLDVPAPDGVAFPHANASRREHLRGRGSPPPRAPWRRRLFGG